MAMESKRTIQGIFGEVWKDGAHLSNFFGAEVTGDISYERVKRSGSRASGNKAGTIEYSGTITGYKVTSELMREIAKVKDDKQGAFVCELIFALKDPEAYGFERVRVKGVQFTKLDVIKFDHGAIVETELPFVCDDYEYLDAITD
jgi:hypothetical protein